MIIVDKALEKLEKESNPIRVGLVGAGFAGRGFMLQMLDFIKGMRLVAVSNRTRSGAVLGFKQGGYTNYKDVKSLKELEGTIKIGKTALTNNPFLLTDSRQIDVIVEATGEVEFGAQVVLRAIEKGKHTVLINAELDSTLGPILKVKADRKNVVYTQAEGDQPGALMNLFRQVKGWGFKPVMVGNIKSLIDVRRTPKTQERWANEHFQRPKMVTSFADGTKIGAEMATIANATGFPVSKRGMEGPKCDRVENAYKLFNFKKLTLTGLTDYVLGAEPSFGIFVLATCDQKIRRRYIKIYKMGSGPLYTFYTPYHLSPLEAPISVARAAIFKDAVLAPIGKPICDVVTLAKRDIRKGEKLDGIGGFLTYGAIDNYDVSLKDNLLPIGLSEGCIVKQDIKIDAAITYDMVKLPKKRISDKLRKEQNKMFFGGK
ncbi:MAG: NAD(P)-dependent oxidoreductase [Candidatus Levybacteria bacterium]|nr:NAD(P)-dependent oxidoreductase [Candidatus Levybacteria bacterium]